MTSLQGATNDVTEGLWLCRRDVSWSSRWWRRGPVCCCCWSSCRYVRRDWVFMYGKALHRASMSVTLCRFLLFFVCWMSRRRLYDVRAARPTCCSQRWQVLERACRMTVAWVCTPLQIVCCSFTESQFSVSVIFSSSVLSVSP